MTAPSASCGAVMAQLRLSLGRDTPWDTPVNSHTPDVLPFALYLFMVTTPYQTGTAFSACSSADPRSPNWPDHSCKIRSCPPTKKAPFIGVKLPTQGSLKGWWDRKPRSPSMLQGMKVQWSSLLSPIVSESVYWLLWKYKYCTTYMKSKEWSLDQNMYHM